MTEQAGRPVSCKPGPNKLVGKPLVPVGKLELADKPVLTGKQEPLVLQTKEQLRRGS